MREIKHGYQPGSYATGSTHRGLLGPFMALHGLDAEPDGMHDPAPEHR